MEELSFAKGTIVFQFTNEKVTLLNASSWFQAHSTVTDLARLRGWSTSVPLMSAMW